MTIAAPPVLSWFVTTAPKYDLSPTARKRGNAGLSVTGLLIRISVSPAPNRDARSAATAMMRYVVSDSGSLTLMFAWPLTSVATEPSQNASTRKSRRTVPGPPSLPPPPPSVSPFGVSTRRDTIRWRLSSFTTSSAFCTYTEPSTSGVLNAVSDRTP